jgi:serine/threonine-protein phosphatase 2A activator
MFKITHFQDLIYLHEPFANLALQAVEEISEYLKESFGNRERIDYGSGHELNFICWLYLPRFQSNLRLCLRQLDILGQEDYKPLVLLVFNRY